ncbi:MAG: hypothetical protein H0T75_01465 [Rhizobiales bacterium]|nr:hypothetical protein [Hyphomicrobiales bacterium]
MAGREIVVTAWNNGGPGYGFKMSAADRNSCLKREWGAIELYLPGHAQPIRVNIDKDSMWNDTCREVISKDIGAWMRSTGIAPWPAGSPPKFRLTPRSERSFDVRPI